MKQKLEEVVKDSSMKPVPSKLALTKKPMEESEILVHDQMGVRSKAWRARVRLVACGNYGQGTKPGDLWITVSQGLSLHCKNVQIQTHIRNGFRISHLA